MSALLSIGEFSRSTHLSVKALRYYDDVGLLRPADVDATTGYRFYATAQVPAAQLIRRFRELDMPIEEVKVVLEAPDVDTRDAAIVAHLQRMEGRLEETQATIGSLRALLEGRPPSITVEYRSVHAAPALAIRAEVTWDGTVAWLATAFAELYERVEQDGAERGGPDGALYSSAYFEAHEGEIVAFVPVSRSEPATATGRVTPFELPPGLFAITVHHGSFDEMDQSYAALGTHVAEQKIAGDGFIRENYLVTDDEVDDVAQLRTEVCWPVTHRPR
jgi:DNA-binding transcriptional MerR regulator